MVNSSVEVEAEMSFFVTKSFVKRKYETDKGWIIDFDHVNSRLFQSFEEAPTPNTSAPLERSMRHFTSLMLGRTKPLK